MAKEGATTRRNYLKMSSASLLPLGLAGRSFEDRTTIPLLMSGDEVVEKTDISIDWWDHTTHVEKVLDQSRARLQEAAGYYTSYI